MHLKYTRTGRINSVVAPFFMVSGLQPYNNLKTNKFVRYNADPHTRTTRTFSFSIINTDPFKNTILELLYSLKLLNHYKYEKTRIS